MVYFTTGVDVGLALLLAALLAKYASLKLEARTLNLLTSGALLFILAGVLEALNVLGALNLGALSTGVNLVLNTAGGIAVAVAALWSVYSLVTGRK